MAQLRRDYSKFTERQAEVLVIGPDSEQAFTAYWKENRLPFVGLPDPEENVLKAYGQEFNLFKLGRMPALLIVDKEGIIRFVHYGSAMSDIPKNEEVLAILDKLNTGD